MKGAVQPRLATALAAGDTRDTIGAPRARLSIPWPWLPRKEKFMVTAHQRPKAAQAHGVEVVVAIGMKKPAYAGFYLTK